MMYMSDILRTLGLAEVELLFESSDGAAECKAGAVQALIDDRMKRMRAYLALRDLISRGCHRLADGTPIKLGMRVLKIREAMTADGLDHAWDDEERVITSLHQIDGRAVECGPEQIGLKYLQASR